MSDEVRRFFVEDLVDGPAEIALGDDAAHHARVLRLGVGAAIVLFDGSGREAHATVIGAAPLRAAHDAPIASLPDRPTVQLVQVLPKGKKIDAIVRMVTELGVDAIHLAISERAVSRPDVDRGQGRVERLARIAREASRQARRRTLPEVHPPATLEEVIHRAPDSADRLVFWENATSPLPARLASRDVWVVVGPEGGLSHTEVKNLEEQGWGAVRMGMTILRVETAAPVAVALILDRSGRLCR